MPQGLSCMPRPFRVALVIFTCLVSFGLAQNEKILYNFEALPQGADPMSNLIADAAGNLYGTTPKGGAYGGGSWTGSGTVFELSPASEGKWTEKVLYNFPGGSDANPGGLVFDTAGNLYGTAGDSIFKLSPSPRGQWIESNIYTFAGYPNDGWGPVGNLIFDSAGNLFGATIYGGNGSCPRTFGCGTVFELSPASGGKWTEKILYNFQNSPDGAWPEGSLIFDSAGNLFGNTGNGGEANCYDVQGCGVVFELSPNRDGTWTESILHTFTYSGSDGIYPQGSLASDAAGDLYGATSGGPGSGPACDGFGCGDVFRLHPGSDGWTYSIIYSFGGGLDGAYPMAGLVLHSGRLYGTTQQGGGGSCYQNFCAEGTVFELTPHSGDNWTERIIHSFATVAAVTVSEDGGSFPVASLLFDQLGNLYGTAEYGGNYAGACNGGCGTVFKLSPSPAGLWGDTTLYRFPSAGAFAPGTLSSDGSGNLYGVGGGGKNYCYGAWGCGTVFLLEHQKGGVRSVVLHSFNGIDDGAAPVGPLVVDRSGNLYGATEYGGSEHCLNTTWYCGGTVFELSPSAYGWKEKVLYKFRLPSISGQPSDGQQIMAGLIMDSEGDLYGTTSRGGSGNCGYTGCGTVFKLTQTPYGEWKEELLYLFQGGLDGGGPDGSLVFDDSGALYGTTYGGGAYSGGTVFKLIPGSNGRWTKQILYNFGSQHGDSLFPAAGLVADGNGNFFGTTSSGGNPSYYCQFGYGTCGTVFELSPTGSGTWKETVLLSFQGTDGSNPNSALILDEAGNLYGAAPGGSCCQGTIFELSPGSNGWTEHILHTFGNGNDGAGPNGPLLFDQDGNIVGTTSAGGLDAVGTVFELSLYGLTEEWSPPK